MIIFEGTKTVGTQTFFIFKNENNGVIHIPVDAKTALVFLHHFDRLAPTNTKPVESE